MANTKKELTKVYNALSGEEKKETEFKSKADVIAGISEHAQGGGSITVDTEMNDSSTNAVQNKAITAALGNKAGIYSITITFREDKAYITQDEIDYIYSNKPPILLVNTQNNDTTTVIPTILSPNIYEDVMYFYDVGDQWFGIVIPQDAANEVIQSDTHLQTSLSFDNTPTTDSNNPVKSGGVKEYVDNKASLIVAMAYSGNTLTADKTFFEIKTAADSGRVVIMQYEIEGVMQQSLYITSVSYDVSGGAYIITYAGSDGVETLTGAANDYPTVTLS